MNAKPLDFIKLPKVGDRQLSAGDTAAVFDWVKRMHRTNVGNFLGKNLDQKEPPERFIGIIMATGYLIDKDDPIFAGIPPEEIPDALEDFTIGGMYWVHRARLKNQPDHTNIQADEWEACPPEDPNYFITPAFNYAEHATGTRNLPTDGTIVVEVTGEWRPVEIIEYPLDEDEPPTTTDVTRQRFYQFARSVALVVTTGLIMCCGPRGSVLDPNYTDNRYWVGLAKPKETVTDETPIKFELILDEDEEPTIVTADNLCEYLEKSHYLYPGQPVELKQIAMESGDTRWIMES